jgi:hypothetical protein
MSQMSTPSVPQSACCTIFLTVRPSIVSVTVFPGQNLHHSAPTSFNLWHNRHTIFSTCFGGGAAIIDSTIFCICVMFLDTTGHVTHVTKGGNLGIFCHAASLAATCCKIHGISTPRRKFILLSAMPLPLLAQSSSSIEKSCSQAAHQTSCYNRFYRVGSQYALGGPNDGNGTARASTVGNDSALAPHPTPLEPAPIPTLTS